MMVLICLIFSVLSTIDQYEDFANATLFWMVSCLSFTIDVENLKFTSLMGIVHACHSIIHKLCIKMYLMI